MSCSGDVMSGGVWYRDGIVKQRGVKRRQSEARCSIGGVTRCGVKQRRSGVAQCFVEYW